MDEKNWLAERFEADRARLRTIAHRMLGSANEAEDAVQETWLRLSRSDAAAIENLGGWLTTVVGRVCLDMLRARKARREEPMDEPLPDEMEPADAGPERERLLADSVGLALLIVLDTLSPLERVAFVLHDLFDLPFEEIAPIIDRSPAAARQLASRARRRVRGAQPLSDSDLARQRQLVEAFLAAAREGNFEGLLSALAPDVIFRSDAAAVRMGGQAELRGAEAVAQTFRGRAQGARAALVGGVVGVAVSIAGQVRIVLRLTVAGDRIAAIEAIADPQQIERLDVALFDAPQ